MSKKYVNKSKLMGKIGSENYKVSNCPVHLPKENIKFFMAMQDAGNKDPFSTSTYANQITPDWKKVYEQLYWKIDRIIYNTLNEAKLGLTLDNDDNDDIQAQSHGNIKNIYSTKDYLIWEDLIKKVDNLDFDFNDFYQITSISRKMGLKYKVKADKEINSKNLTELIEYIVRNIDEECDLNWIDVSEITDMSYLFEKSKFNGDISEWDVSHVTDMAYMFTECAFAGDFTDISNWDTSQVQYMDGMFAFCPFDKPDICNWNVQNVISTANMFAESLFQQDISNWNLPLACDVSDMFNKHFPDEYKPKIIKLILNANEGICDVKENAEIDDDLNEGFMFEGEFGGMNGPYNTPMNTIGVGNVIPAGVPGMTGAQQASDSQNGSGDIANGFQKKSKKKDIKKSWKKLSTYFPIATKK